MNMNWRSKDIWIEFLRGSRKTSNFFLVFYPFFRFTRILSVPTCGAQFFWNVGSGYDQFDRKKGIVCIFRWGFPGLNRRIFLRFLMKDIQSIRIEDKEGFYSRRVLYMEIRGQGSIPLTRTDDKFLDAARD
ncbi:hypothetical protein LUZ63_021513 [Rhynchospora breviuscula]|uniref:Photosystem I assembly protein Ycf4 n=1 Tax=Rhynchospora breviuscula TaxID=2022672 RepID=A0A9P9Z731_9POAL|nr:hypothetical protein LUZ63_021513 [Rhynchospora breviuscula]